MNTVRTSDALRLRMHYAPADKTALGDAGSRTAFCGEVTYDEARYQQIIGRKLRDDEHFDRLRACPACGSVVAAHRAVTAALRRAGLTSKATEAEKRAAS